MIPDRARAALHFLPPARRLLPHVLCRAGSWLHLKLLGVRRVETRGIETMIRLTRQMQERKVRFLVAFTHPSTDDPTVVFRLVHAIVAREARRFGGRLRIPPRGFFLYGRDVPEWAGRWLAWLLPRIGAVSVYSGRFEAKSLALIRRLLVDSVHPLVLAPEGQVTYHNEKVAALEPGTAQMAFWCRDDLTRQGRTEDVLVLPVCVSYHYRESDWKGVGRLLGKIERECGLPSLPSTPGEKPYARVMRVVRFLVVTAEAHYARTHAADPRGDGDDRVEALQQRLEAIVESALTEAERHFKVKPHGGWVQRVMAVRYAGLGWIHREDIEDAEALPPLARALAGRLAAEAWLCLRHLELADVLEYVRLDYLSPGSGIDRYVETVTTLWDVVNRLKGGNISGRGTPFPRTARIEIAEPIPVARFLDAYQANRRRGVAELTDAIARVFRATAERGGPGDAGAVERGGA